MKKFAVLLTGLALISFASCKKEYTCDCVTTDSGGNFEPSTQTSTVTLKKKDAEEWCEGSSSVSTPFTTVCTLK